MVGCGSSDKSTRGGSGGSSSAGGSSSTGGSSSGGDQLDAATACADLFAALCVEAKACGLVVGQSDGGLLCLNDCTAFTTKAVPLVRGSCIGGGDLRQGIRRWLRHSDHLCDTCSDACSEHGPGPRRVRGRPEAD